MSDSIDRLRARAQKEETFLQLMELARLDKDRITQLEAAIKEIAIPALEEAVRSYDPVAEHTAEEALKQLREVIK